MQNGVASFLTQRAKYLREAWLNTWNDVDSEDIAPPVSDLEPATLNNFPILIYIQQLIRDELTLS